MAHPTPFPANSAVLQRSIYSRILLPNLCDKIITLHDLLSTDKTDLPSAALSGFDRVLTGGQEYRILCPMTKITSIPFSEKVKNKIDWPVTVMTFNLRFGLAKDGLNAWEHRKPLVSKILDTYPCDFIGFQEVNHFQAEFLTRSLMHHGHIGWFNKGVKWWQNCLILFDSSWECLGHRHFFLSHTPDIPSRLPGSRWPRQCVIGWFKKKNRYLLMANTHFDFTSEVQQKSAGLVMEFLKHFPKGVPQIITGDFNTTPGSPAHQCFKSCGFDLVMEGESVTTFHEFTGKKTGHHIDWILYASGLSPVFEQVIQDAFDGLFPSDHYPVRAGFT